jgi:hypothetical protein
MLKCLLHGLKLSLCTVKSQTTLLMIICVFCKFLLLCLFSYAGTQWNVKSSAPFMLWRAVYSALIVLYSWWRAVYSALIMLYSWWRAVYLLDGTVYEHKRPTIYLCKVAQMFILYQKLLKIWKCNMNHEGWRPFAVESATAVSVDVKLPAAQKTNASNLIPRMLQDAHIVRSL